jgi:hypothetical protein
MRQEQKQTASAFHLDEERGNPTTVTETIKAMAHRSGETNDHCKGWSNTMAHRTANGETNNCKVLSNIPSSGKDERNEQRFSLVTTRPPLSPTMENNKFSPIGHSGSSLSYAVQDCTGTNGDCRGDINFLPKVMFWLNGQDSAALSRAQDQASSSESDDTDDDAMLNLSSDRRDSESLGSGTSFGNNENRRSQGRGRSVSTRYCLDGDDMQGRLAERRALILHSQGIVFSPSGATRDDSVANTTICTDNASSLQYSDYSSSRINNVNRNVDEEELTMCSSIFAGEESPDVKTKADAQALLEKLALEANFLRMNLQREQRARQIEEVRDEPENQPNQKSDPKPKPHKMTLAFERVLRKRRGGGGRSLAAASTQSKKGGKVRGFFFGRKHGKESKERE